MTRIHVTTDEHGHTEIECRGHAGASDVCAAISALMCAMGAWARDHGKDVRETRRDGYMRLEFSGCGEQVAFVAAALARIARQWPENVRLDTDIFV